MPITFACPHCGKRYQVDDAMAGRSGNCRGCGRRMEVPAGDAPQPEPPVVATLGRRVPAWALAGLGGLLLAAIALPLLINRRGGREVPAAPPVPAFPDAPLQPQPRAVTEKAAPTVASAGETRRFEGHTGAVSAVEFFPDGRRAVSGGDTTLRLWDLATGKELRRDEGSEPVRYLAVSPDGQQVLSARGRVLFLLDTETGKEAKRLEGHSGDVNRVAFAPDGRRAASTSWDNTVRLWDLEAGQELHRASFGGATTGVVFAPDGRSLLAGSADHTARLLDADGLRERRRFEGHVDWVGEVAFAPDGRTVATGEGLKTGLLRIWDVDQPSPRLQLRPGPDSGWSTRFTPDGRRLLVVAFDQVVLVEAATGRELRRFRGHSGQVTCVRIAPDGRRFLSSGQDRTVRLWDLPPDAAAPALARVPVSAPAPTSKPAPTPPATPRVPDASAALAKAAEARRTLDADKDGEHADTLQPAFNEAFRAAAPALIEVVPGSVEHPAGLTRVVLNSRRLGLDGLRLRAPASGPRLDLRWEFIMPAEENDRGRAMQAWYILPLAGDMAGFTGYTMGQEGPVEGVNLPRKYHVVQRLEGAQIRPGNEYLIWFSFPPDAPPVPTYVRMDLVPPAPDVRERIEAGRTALRRTIDLPESASGLASTSDGRRMLALAGSAILTADLESGQVRKRWEGPPGNARTAAFSPDGKLAAVGGGDGKIQIIDLEAGKELRTCEGHTGGLRCLAFLPDGKQFVSGAEDHTARLWDVATGKEVRRFEGHSDQVLCLAVSPDGRRLVTGPSVGDKVARVWNLATGKLVARLEGNAEAVYALAFSPDGKAVLTGGEDTSLRTYDAASGRPFRRFKPDNGSKVHALAVFPDGRRAVAGSESGFLTFWSTRRGRFLRSYEADFPGCQILALAHGDTLLAACGDRKVRVWSLPAADPILDVPPPTRADLAYLRSIDDDLESTTLEQLDELDKLTLGAQVDDAGLAHLARLANLDWLTIRDAGKLRGNGLAHLKPLSRLRILDLARSAVGDAGLAHVAGLKRLESLNLAGTRVSDAGIERLRPLDRLRQLEVQDTAVTDASLPVLEALPSLDFLKVHGSKLGPDALARLRRARPWLRIDE